MYQCINTWKSQVLYKHSLYPNVTSKILMWSHVKKSLAGLALWRYKRGMTNRLGLRTNWKVHSNLFKPWRLRATYPMNMEGLWIFDAPVCVNQAFHLQLSACIFPTKPSVSGEFLGCGLAMLRKAHLKHGEKIITHLPRKNKVNHVPTLGYRDKLAPRYFWKYAYFRLKITWPVISS